MSINTNPSVGTKAAAKEKPMNQERLLRLRQQLAADPELLAAVEAVFNQIPDALRMALLAGVSGTRCWTSLLSLMGDDELWARAQERLNETPSRIKSFIKQLSRIYDEQEWINELKLSDREFEDYCNQNRRRLAAFARKMCASEQQDIEYFFPFVDDVILKAGSRLRAADCPRSLVVNLTGFFRRSVRNLIFDYWRSERGFNQMKTVLDSFTEIADPDFGASFGTEQLERFLDGDSPTEDEIDLMLSDFDDADVVDCLSYRPPFAVLVIMLKSHGWELEEMFRLLEQQNAIPKSVPLKNWMDLRYYIATQLGHVKTCVEGRLK